MEADRYLPARGLNPSAAGLSALVAGSLFAALVFIAPKVLPTADDPPITLIPIAAPTPPPPVEPRPTARTSKPASTPTHISPPIAEVPVPTSDVDVAIRDPGPVAPIPAPEGPAVDPGPPIAPTPPVLIDASVDPRFAGDFQPPYPPEETRAGHEGIVVVRVLIGVDGRVKAIEQVSAASEAFWRVTQRRALSAWRFRPATRDGIPEERWRVMRVRFVLNTAD